MGNEEITLIGIIVTFLIGIINFIYSIVNNKKTRFVNTVTSARVEWINNLRENISVYISLIPMKEYDFLRMFNKKDEFIEKFMKINMILELMLNKEEQSNENLIIILKNIKSLIEDSTICLTLLYFETIKEYNCLSLDHIHNKKIDFINKLSENSHQLFVDKIIGIVPKRKELNNKSNLEIIIYLEYSGWGIKNNAYLECINVNCKNIESEIKKLLINSSKLLKKEWERVKEESKVGKSQE